MVNIPKMCNYMLERVGRHGHIVIIFVLCVVYWGRRHLVLGGILESCHQSETALSYSEGSSGQLLGVLGGSLEFGRAPVLVKSSQKLKIGPIF